MSIYTKSGDEGFSSTVSRRHIPKNSPVFDLLGSLDECASLLGTAKAKVSSDKRELIDKIQADISAVCGEVAGAMPFATTEKVLQLENAIDMMMNHKDIDGFVKQGKTEAGAIVDFSRAVMRRAERQAVTMSQSGGVSRELLSWLNRMSDFLYAFARVCDRTQTEIKEFSGNSFFERAQSLCRLVIQKAREENLLAVAAVCDGGGNLVCLNRDDDAYIASIEVASKKAYTAVALKMTTLEAKKMVEPGEALDGLQHSNLGKIILLVAEPHFMIIEKYPAVLVSAAERLSRTRHWPNTAPVNGRS